MWYDWLGRVRGKYLGLPSAAVKEHLLFQDRLGRLSLVKYFALANRNVPTSYGGALFEITVGWGITRGV